jgi:type I restriction enzyme S subunit
LAAIRSSDELNRDFLFYQLWHLQPDIAGREGAVFASINKAEIEALPLAFAPLPEQQRIVGILDEAFEGIAIAKANAERNLHNARALFESHLQSIFTQRGKGWDRVTLETLLERGWIESHLDGNHGSDYPRKDEFINEGVPYISANCLDDERVDMTRAKYLSPSRAELLRKGIAKDNDVLFAHNATVGPVAILHTDEKKVILGTSLTYYRCNRKHILPEYLAHYMRSFGFKSQYLQVMKQSTRNQVPITKQREFFHVIPPLDEQKEIVGALDGLFENGQRLESIYQQKLATLDELKKSLLHKAFNGEL